MEWATVQHLDLRHVGRGQKPLQPHAAAFHPSQALIAAAIGNYIIVVRVLWEIVFVLFGIQWVFPETNVLLGVFPKFPRNHSPFLHE
uniref:Uncharacterized protein n=1 Tax=Vitis vinifera TaxID=29760 RepID=F6HJH5_VITVI